jgi:hypothetical protein
MELPIEIVELIFFKLPEEDWKNFAIINKKNYNDYIQIKKYLIKEIKNINDFISLSFNGNIESIKEITRKQTEIDIDWDLGIYHSAHGCHINLVDYMISKGGDVNSGLEGACMSGNRNMIEYMFHQDADNLDEALSGACKGGNINIVYYIIDKGKPYLCFNWCQGLRSACVGGNLKIVKMMMRYVESDGRTFYQIQLNDILYYGCYGGNKKVVEYLIKKGFDNWNEGLYGACQGGYKSLVDYMILKGANKLKKAISYTDDDDLIDYLKHL